jgi:N-acetylglucosamine-6-sulfatase
MAELCWRQANYADILYRRRWQSLLSVDDLIEEVVKTLTETGQLENTYIVSTADHGYRLVDNMRDDVLES